MRGNMLHSGPVLRGPLHVIILFLFTGTRESGLSHGRSPDWQLTASNYKPAALSSLCLSVSLSSSAAGGTTTRTGLGTCPLTVHVRTPAPSAVPCLTPAALLFLERCAIPLCGAT